MAINQKSAFIIEILIVIAIIFIALTSLLGVATFSLRISTLMKETTKANLITQEVMEAVRNIRDDNWAKISTDIVMGQAYYPEIDTNFSPPKWKLTLGEKTENGFTRKVIFSDVQRDTNDNIVEIGGTNDPNTKKATVTVSWRDKKVQIVTYLTNWKQ